MIERLRDFAHDIAYEFAPYIVALVAYVAALLVFGFLVTTFDLADSELFASFMGVFLLASAVVFAFGALMCAVHLVFVAADKIKGVVKK